MVRYIREIDGRLGLGLKTYALTLQNTILFNSRIPSAEACTIGLKMAFTSSGQPESFAYMSYYAGNQQWLVGKNLLLAGGDGTGDEMEDRLLCQVAPTM